MYVCLFAFLNIPDSWLANSDSLSLLIQAYIPTCILVCVCMHIFVLFFVCFPEYTCVFSDACVCECFFVSRCAPADKQTQ
jgi:hypothetical protein